jgi:ubiquinone/menaquinone biosynthesis C-methylase UbiE
MPSQARTSLPYFDVLLQKLDSGISALDLAFGRHVHWGCWPDPKRATGTPEDFAAAAELLSKKVYGAAGVGSGQKVLDAGCGFGGTLASLNENFAPIDLTGLNIDPRQIARARGKVQARPGNKLHFVEGDACAMPFPDRSFDVVLAVECIFHFPDRKKFFAEVQRVLKPGGTFAISDFVPRRFFRPYTASRFAKDMLAPLFGPVQMSYTLKDYGELAAATGFTPLFEEDITAGTVPTYPFLRQLKPALDSDEAPNDWGSYGAEWVSRLGWIGYWILAWRKISDSKSKIAFHSFLKNW